jgi:DNA-directed RNA polymerase omega subunit
MVEQTQSMTENIDETIENSEVTENEEVREMPEIDSKYRMILLAAQRAKQLQRGAHTRVELDQRKHKNTRIAMKEIEAKKIFFNTTDS